MNNLTKIFALIKEGNLDDLKNVITVDNVDAVNKYGKTALMYAAEEGRLDVVKYFTLQFKQIFWLKMLLHT